MARSPSGSIITKVGSLILSRPPLAITLAPSAGRSPRAWMSLGKTSLRHKTLTAAADARSSMTSIYETMMLTSSWLRERSRTAMIV